MQVLKTPPQRLFHLAELRLRRQDIGETATWHLGVAGPRILYIHGFRGNHRGLLGIAGALPETRAIIPDLPGYSKTPPLGVEHDLEGYARWLIDFNGELGEVDLVVAHSFGTLVAAKALSLGWQPSKLTLINPISSVATGLGARLADHYYKLGAAQGSNLLSSQLVVRGMSVALAKTKRPGLRSFIHRQHSDNFSQFNQKRVVVEGYRAASGSSVLDMAQWIPSDTLLIAGDRDAVAPLESQRKLSAATGARLTILEGVGHLTHYERPSELAELLAEELRR